MTVTLQKDSGTGISTLHLTASEWKDNAPQTSCYSIEFKRYDAASVKTASKDSDCDSRTAWVFAREAALRLCA